MEKNPTKSVYRVDLSSETGDSVKHVVALDLNEGMKKAEAEFEDVGVVVTGIKFVCKIDLE